MANFSSAIRKGIALAVEKDREGKEISNALRNFDEQLKAFSDNALHLVIDRAEVISLYMDRVDENYYQRLKVVEISTVVGGYPCVVSYGEESIVCHCLEDFEAALVQRLATAEIGKEMLMHLGSA